MTAVQSICNKIYEWNQPSRPCPVRMGLTRIAGVALAAIEFIQLTYHPILVAAYAAGVIAKIVVKIARNICPCIQQLQKWDESLPTASLLLQTGLKTMQLAIHLLSSLLLGIALNPDLNYRLHTHSRIGLADAKLACSKVRKQELLERESLAKSSQLEESKLEDAQKPKSYEEILNSSSQIAQRFA